MGRNAELHLPIFIFRGECNAASGSVAAKGGVSLLRRQTLAPNDTTQAKMAAPEKEVCWLQFLHSGGKRRRVIHIYDQPTWRYRHYITAVFDADNRRGSEGLRVRTEIHTIRSLSEPVPRKLPRSWDSFRSASWQLEHTLAFLFMWDLSHRREEMMLKHVDTFYQIGPKMSNCNNLRALFLLKGRKTSCSCPISQRGHVMHISKSVIIFWDSAFIFLHDWQIKKFLCQYLEMSH